MNSDAVPCLLLPSGEKDFLFPSTAIAEIIPYEQPQLIPDIPEWLLGILSWRGIPIPLTQIEHMASPLAWNSRKALSTESIQKCHIAIINRMHRVGQESVEKPRVYPFFSIVLKDIPKLHRIERESIIFVGVGEERELRYVMEAEIQNDRVFIPNLTNLWEMIDALPERLQWFRERGL